MINGRSKLKQVIGFGALLFILFICYRIYLQFDLNQRYLSYSTRLASLSQGEGEGEGENKNVNSPTLSSGTFNRSYNQRLELLPLNWSVLDTISLNQCALDGLVFANSSTLSRQQQGWYELKFHIQLINGLFACIERVELSQDFKAQLQSLLQQKRSQLPIYWNNFVVSEKALSKQWQAPGLRYDRRREYSQLPLEQLSTLLSLKQQVLSDDLSLPIEFSEDAMLNALEVLDKGIYLSPLIYDLQLALDWMPILNTQLLSKKESIESCQKNQAQLQNNILLKYFIQGLQLELANLDTELLRIRSPLTQLYQGTRNQDWVEALYAKRQHLHQQLGEHVQQWQRLRSPCNS